MIGRNRPPPDSAEVRLARLTAVVDQTLALIDDGLRTYTANRQLIDVLLDVRNLLKPRSRT